MSDDFTKQLQMACRSEGQEHVQLLLNALVKLEFASPQEVAPLVEQSFRSLHNLKGSAHAAEFYTIESLCHPMEDIMAAAKSGSLKISSAMIDLLLEGVSLVDVLFQDEDDTAHAAEIESVLSNLASVMGNVLPQQEADAGILLVEVPDAPAPTKLPTRAAEAPAVLPTTASNAKLAPVAPGEAQAFRKNDEPAAEVRESLRIAADKLDLLMQKAEEMLSLKASARDNSASVNDIRRTIESHARAWSKATSDVKQVRDLIATMQAAAQSPQEQLPWRTMSNALDSFNQVLTQVSGDIKELSRELAASSHTTANAVDSLLEDAKSLLMISCSSMFAGFPLVVRQLSRQLGKEVEITITGGDIEMDRRILGQLKDPLIHILRNCIDHGIESPLERVQAGKPARGTLQITAAQVERIVELRITDDGRGIDSTKVKSSAVKQGLLTREEALSMPVQDALRLIFKSALSTSNQITEISGRGLGLAIVEEMLEQLGGTIEVDTAVGRGTQFILRLPLTIATFRGVVVTVTGTTFVVPTTNIDRVVSLTEESIKPVDGTDTFLYDGVLTPIGAMEEILNLPVAFRPRAEDSLLTVAVVRAGSEKLGLVVDEVVGEQEVLVKNLGPVFADVTAVLGVTVQGSGQVLPILNISEMIKTYRQRRTGAISRPNVSMAEEGGTAREGEGLKRPDRRANVLVVDDMVTARMLMRNILEMAGFAVQTANNGMEALSVLKQQSFDLVVTDLEMPHMDGFRLTEAIRADDKLNSLPVIMVTSMASREDREKGVAAGANAYFVKSNFDQDNLLSIIGNLI